MKKSSKFAALAVAALMVAPVAAQADVSVYGAAKVSVDSITVGDNDNSIGVSSNSSRFGFKGSRDLPNGLKAGVKVEFGFDASGESSTLGARNRYASLGGGFGEIRIGNHDTPFKDVAGKFGLFSDTVADRRNILGLDSTGSDKFNERANNSIMYLSPNMGGLQAVVQYSADYNAASTDEGTDDNNKSLTSASLTYQIDSLTLRAAFESQKQGEGMNDYTGTRINANYKIGSTKVGVIYENLDGGDDKPALTRSAIGVNAAYAMDKTTLKAEYLQANDDDSTNSDTGATNTSVGISHKYLKEMEVYAIYTATTNADNASYTAAAGGHDGDKIKAGAPGDAITAISFGMVYKF